MIRKEGVYIGSEDKKAGFDIHYVNEKRPLVVFCHGFKGFKDWGTFNLIAEYFVKEGFQFAKLNFSHNGTSVDSPVDFVDLEAFGNNNFEKELFDVDSLINQLKTENYSEYLDFDSIYMMGHSKGGATALVYTLENTNIKACATLAAVIDVVSRYGKIKDKNWKKQGVKYVMNGRTNQNMPMYYQFPENTHRLKFRLDIQSNLRVDRRNFLFVHGTNDEAVLPKELDLINNIAHAKPLLIEGANHVFGGSHPYLHKKNPDNTEIALRMIVECFNC